MLGHQATEVAPPIGKCTLGEGLAAKCTPARGGGSAGCFSGAAMDMSEDVVFDKADVVDICANAHEQTCKRPDGKGWYIYDEAKTALWVDGICASVIEQLAATSKPYKYAVTCSITQKTGVGMHSVASCYFDTQVDGVVVYQHPKVGSGKSGKETMLAVVTVFMCEV